MIINELFKVRDQAQRLRIDLAALHDQEKAAYRGRIADEIRSLSDALDLSTRPELFRIAIVGAFKTGKSSFVNKLAAERLAGVETNPETAAISIFRYAETPRAEVKLISAKDWQRMEDLYEDAPAHPEAYRVAGLRGFNKRMEQRKDKNGQPIVFDPIDPDALVAEWLYEDERVHTIKAEKWETKAGKQGFRKRIREFTTSGNPLHYFVKELVVFAPVPLLRDHVELIDTPGLNDTQLYRGQLTEDLLSEVDAILFLTQSGASFSQFDKEFLVRQLRKKRLRHLRLVVTKVDQTFDAACRDAREEDDDPPSISEHLQAQENRLRSEIAATLDELLDETELKEEEGYYYMEQLDALKIHFTSSGWFDDGRIVESGIEEVREALFEVLSENYHLRQMAEHLTRTIEATRSRLKDFFAERRSVMDTEFDLSKVEQAMGAIEDELKVQMDQFAERMDELKGAHDGDQLALQELMDANIARMLLLAREVLSNYEKSDVARHWKSRRHGYWGYLSDVGGKVADRVFPVMESWAIMPATLPFSVNISTAFT